ncbi:homoserine dehydrogenase [Hansschlegelia plantiphila]|uniref:Homoserine dehydrogenase n=1 Tax=Hansschlegelia plantiphila TaxID=374655 RepID=A0A9W6MVY9_9HYPH|nr:homoserine dehydrogenase [Hansschlegelia plantiphila]GLK68292.1 homoserine dehydrogenase [Hansschlegelia plantiphila]
MTAPLKVGVAGLGTVGASVVRILGANAEEIAARAGRPIVVAAVSARDKGRNRGLDLSGASWHMDPSQLARSNDVDVVVELIGGAEGAARACVETAIEARRPVVTANKALLAKHGVAIARAAEAAGVTVGFEAAVAGGVPIVKTLREGLAGNRISRVFGILNGTCNYILTRMEKDKLGFAECLAEAQRLGYAEADPTFDIGGFDAAHKLALLASLAFGTEVDANGIYVEGIASITPFDLAMAEELGFRLKLLGIATRTDQGVEQRVHPSMLPKDSAIARVDGVTNAIEIDGDAVGALVLAGPGAGGDATASAVIADIIDIARGIHMPVFGAPASKLTAPVRAPMGTHHGGYYIRLSVIDRPGAAAAIATRMAEQGISLRSIVQRGREPEIDRPNPDPVAVVLITYATNEAALRVALDAIEADGHIDGAPQVIRIEKR